MHIFSFSIVGKEIVDLGMDDIRKMADNCTKMQGLLVFNDVTRGTRCWIEPHIICLYLFPQITASSSALARIPYAWDC